MHRTLILMRHGQAAAPEDTADHERPLTDHGVAQARSAGSWLARTQPAVDEVLCSTALRTRRTLDAVADGAGYETAPAHPPITLARPVYNADADALLGEIAFTDDDVSTLLVIGHFPGLPQTALTLDPDGPMSAEVRRGMPTAACVVLRTDFPWAALLDAARGMSEPFGTITHIHAH